jgi:hypothetical protein
MDHAASLSETRAGPCKAGRFRLFRLGPKRDHVTASDSDASLGLQVHFLLSYLLLLIIKDSLVWVIILFKIRVFLSLSLIYVQDIL